MKKNIAENLYAQRNRIDRETKEINEAISYKRRRIALIAVAAIFVGVSIINMASASFDSISTKGYGILLSHVKFMGIAIVAGLVFYLRFNYKFFNKNKMCFVMLLFSLGAFAFLYFGHRFLPTYVPRINGAIGWIKVKNFTVQPAEILKIPYIMILAHLFEKCEEKKMKGMGTFFTIIPIVILYLIGLYAQQDLGTALHYLAIFAFMLFMSNFSLKWITGIASIGLIFVSSIFYYIFSKDEINSTDYKIKRIASFLDGLIKNEYDNSFGYQVGQSLNAFGNGGLIGKGYANGVQKYNYLPEIRTDFVMACFGEEFGFLGMVSLLIFVFLAFSIIKNIAMNAKDYFGKFLAIGIAGYLIIQVLINVCVAIGMLPVFGIPMPLFSYGGSSLVTVMVALGIVLNINERNR